MKGIERFAGRKVYPILKKDNVLGIVYFYIGEKQYYLDLFTFVKEVTELDTDIFDYLDIRSINFYIEDEKGIHIIKEFEDYNELWSQSNGLTYPEKRRMINIKSLLKAKEVVS